MNINHSYLTDDELLHGLKLQNPQILKPLYDKYAGAILGVIARALDKDQHEDAIKYVFLKAWCSIGEYEPSRCRLLIWLINLARKHARSLLIAKGIIEDKTKIANPLIELNISSICSPTESVVIILSYYKGYTIEEISEKLDFSQKTILKLLSTGLLKLRKHFN